MTELRTLGRYRVLRRLGRGGMANVYLAELSGEHGFAKTVAIKTIHPHRAGEPRFVGMFLEEMRVASRLSHPNVCAVLDFGMEDETPYLVMEHLDGFPLSALLRSDSVGIPRDIAARIVADAARGLHAAHELAGLGAGSGGIVHRDVSPQNVMLLRTGVTKVLDFGIAKASDPSGAITSSHPKGKLRYMAPEQLAGAAVDRRADIWALGVVLWEATLGQRLFADGATAASVLSQGIARPSSLDPKYPQALEDVVMATLKRNPDRRPPTAAHVADALESFLYSLGKPCGAGQISAWLASRATLVGEADTTSSTPGGAHDATATAPQRDPIATAPRPAALLSSRAAPRSETETLGLGILGHDVADLSTVILPQPDTVTPTPGPGGSAHTPETPRPRRLAVAASVAVAAAAVILAVVSWVGIRTALEPTNVATPGDHREVGSAPPIDGARAHAGAAPSGASANRPASSAEPSPIPTPLGPPATATSTGATRPSRPAASHPTKRSAPDAPPSAAAGAISVNADPPASITIDGRAFGRTPFHARPLAAGRHQLVARSLDGSLTRRLVIDVPANGHVRVNPFRAPQR